MRPNEAAIELIRKHIPSITDEMDEGIGEWDGVGPRDEIGEYIGDQRICRCGKHIDGYYDYVDHLIEVFGGKRGLT